MCRHHSSIAEGVKSGMQRKDKRTRKGERQKKVEKYNNTSPKLEYQRNGTASPPNIHCGGKKKEATLRDLKRLKKKTNSIHTREKEKENEEKKEKITAARRRKNMQKRIDCSSLEEDAKRTQISGSLNHWREKMSHLTRSFCVCGIQECIWNGGPLWPMCHPCQLVISS